MAYPCGGRPMPPAGGASAGRLRPTGPTITLLAIDYAAFRILAVREFSLGEARPTESGP